MSISKLQTEENVNEIILIIKAVKRHLQEEKCAHSINAIVKEALENKNGLGNEPNPDRETTKPVTKRFSHV